MSQRLVTSWRGLSRSFAHQLLQDGQCTNARSDGASKARCKLPLTGPKPRWAPAWASTATLRSITSVAEGGIEGTSDPSSCSEEDEPGTQVAASTSIIPIRCPLQSLADDPFADLEPGTSHRVEALLPNGATLHLEAGATASLSDGACTARIGDTVVLATVHAPKQYWKHIGAAQRLLVEYRQPAYATNQLPSNLQRKGSPLSDTDVTKICMAQHAFRGLLADDYRYPVYVRLTVQAYPVSGPLMATLLHAGSAALACSDVPWNGPLAAVGVTYRDGRWEAALDVLKPKTRSIFLTANEAGITMLNVQGDGMTAAVISEGVKEALKHVGPILEAQQSLARAAGRTTRAYPPSNVDPAAMGVVDAMARPAIQEVFATSALSSRQRQQMLESLQNDLVAKLRERGLMRSVHTRVRNSGLLTNEDVTQALPMVQQHVMADMLVQEGLRVDGRSALDVRPLTVQQSPLPVVHGSVVISQGASQVLGVCTVDGLLPQQSRDTEQLIVEVCHMSDSAPIFSRRANIEERVDANTMKEIFSGELGTARAQQGGKFPFAIKLDTEVLADDGSTCMMGITANSLAMRAAGLSMGSPLAGVHVGLLAPTRGDVDLSTANLMVDPTELEASVSPLDMQVAGTAEGLSKVSMIMDGRPLPVGILDSALQEAATALGEMLGSLPETLPTDGRFTVVPLPSSTVAERLTSRMKHARAAGDVRLAREVRAYVVPSTAYVYAATRRGWEWFDKQLQVVSSERRAENDPVNVGKTFEVLVHRVGSHSVLCKLASGLIVKMLLAEASQTPVLHGKELGLKEGDAISVVFTGFDKSGQMIISRKAFFEQGLPAA